MRDHRHDCMSLKRINDGTWQLWCGCGALISGETVSRVTDAHAEHTMRSHLDETYGAGKL